MIFLHRASLLPELPQNGAKILLSVSKSSGESLAIVTDVLTLRIISASYLVLFLSHETAYSVLSTPSGITCKIIMRFEVEDKKKVA